MSERTILAAILVACAATSAGAQSFEETNDCQGTLEDPCTRTGTCSIQGATWWQEATLARSGIFDTQGWPGLCDMVHVALVQGDCFPGGRFDVVASLSADSDAWIPRIDGPLACASAVVSVCDDGYDNDRDGVVDWPDDPGCEAPDDASERPACGDSLDNDGDGWADAPDDPGCPDADGPTESPACQNGVDDDGDGSVDFDGGQSIHGLCTGAPGGCPAGVSDGDGDGVADPDPQCVDRPWARREAAGGSCGLGGELALALPGLAWLRRRRARRVR